MRLTGNHCLHPAYEHYFSLSVEGEKEWALAFFGNNPICLSSSWLPETKLRLMNFEIRETAWNNFLQVCRNEIQFQQLIYAGEL